MLRRFLPAPVLAVPRLLLLSVFAALNLAVLLAPAHAATLSAPPKSWKLLFVHAGDIWIANGDGTGQHLLIKNADVPCWSPDRRYIAFERDSNIWVALADGTRQKPLTHRWKPLKGDGDDIAGVENIGIAWDKGLAIFYSHGHESSGPQSPAGTLLDTIPLRPLEDSLLLHLDYYGADSSFGFSDQAFPAVSRSGNYCSFVCNGDLWIAARDTDKDSVPGWEFSRLKAVAEYDHGSDRADAWELGATHLSWSPDERFLAYSLCRLTGTGQYEIHVIKVHQGHSYTPTAQSDREICADGTYPSFSPDGSWIAYCGPTPGEGPDPTSIWAMKSNGDDAHLVIKDASSPAW